VKKIVVLLIPIFILGLTACNISTDEAEDANIYNVGSNETSDSDKALFVEGTEIDAVLNEIRSESDGILEKLVSFGLTTEEASAGAHILRQCGVPSIDICEPTDPNATVDGLISYRGKIDDDRIFMFTIENREIFYVAFNGEDLYDEDNGGFLKNFSDVHIPETEIDNTTKIRLIEDAEIVLDKYFPYDTRYYDAWAVGREDNNYMVQCQISDGSILLDYWIYGRVWYEEQGDGSFVVIGVKIGDKQYEVE